MAEPKSTTDQENQPETNPVGRPLKFKTVAELDTAIDRYFDDCDPHIAERMRRNGATEKGKPRFDLEVVMTDQVPYTMSGLALALGLTRQSLLNYKDRDEFFDSIVNAKTRCEQYAESQLFVGNSNGAKFNLTNNHEGWSDKQVLAGDPEAPVGALVRIIRTDEAKE